MNYNQYNADLEEDKSATPKDCKELYSNSSDLSQIDTLAKELFNHFSNLKSYISKVEVQEASLNFSDENLDKVGYLFTSDQLEFGTTKSQGVAIPDKIRVEKKRNTQLLKESRNSRLRVNGSSTNMTSTISNSKVC